MVSSFSKMIPVDPVTSKEVLAVIAVKAPVEAEFTGPCFSPDWKTLFLSVQHPGEKSISLRNTSSKWPKEKGGPKPAVISISGKLLKDIMT